MSVSAVMVPYGNEAAALTRLRRDLLPALKLLDGDAELIVVDNSPQRLDELAEAVCDNGVCPARYRWQGGANLMYGPAINLAVGLAHHPRVLYVCANHGQSFDPSWAADLLGPLDIPHVAMTGCLRPAGSPTDHGFPDSLPHHHVQGGVFAATRFSLATYPYPEKRYAHWGADVYQCFRLMHEGWHLVDVPTVRSVWRDEPGTGNWKFLHRGGGDADE